MDASSGQQHQNQMGTNSLENMLVCSKSQQQERKPRPQPEQALKCPRCDSTNTKFCYYNNYSLSQPRYFCKSCRRYWTKGGTLRNVPVGGGCRKNKRSSSSSTTTSSTSSASSKRIQDHLHQPLFTTDHIPNIINPLTGLPHLGYDTNDLSLAFDRLQKQNGGQMGGFDHDHDHDHQHHLHHHDFPILGGLNPSSNSPSPAFLDALRSGFLETHNNINNNFQNLYYGYGGGNLGEIHENVNGSGGVNGGEMLQLTNYEDHHHHQHHHQHHNMSNSNTSNSSNATTTAVTVTTMKQEFCNNSNNISSSRENDNKILWGYPWQLNNGGGGGGDHHGNLVGGDLDSTGRESWNGFNSSNWHGLLNSPLM
ncbi:hypothetical protein Q3G72_006988 [Acer saccharum]|nr:hypothetical protein Q3G72_006988 [Acer saccharum]